MYESNSGKIFNTPIDALLEDLKDHMISTGDKPSHGIAAEDVVKVLRWTLEDHSEALDSFLLEMVETKFGVKIDPPPVVESQSDEVDWDANRELQMQNRLENEMCEFYERHRY